MLRKAKPLNCIKSIVAFGSIDFRISCVFRLGRSYNDRFHRFRVYRLIRRGDRLRLFLRILFLLDRKSVRVIDVDLVLEQAFELFARQFFFAHQHFADVDQLL